MRALVTGATGLIGSHLVARLQRPRVLVRDPARALRELGDVDAVAWNAREPVAVAALDGIDTVFHLAGESLVGERLTPARKQIVRDSRVLGTRAVVDAMRAASPRPRVLVAASAIGFYGSRGDEALTEESAQGADFLAVICREWEEEALAARALGVRVVCARMGIVLARDGGALVPMRSTFRFGVGGPMGSGEQWMSWVHIDDAVGLLLHAAQESAVDGPMNVCAPTPERNARFATALGRAMHRPAWLRTPAAALRLALGEMADVILSSQSVIPAKALATGYTFRFEALDEALADLSGDNVNR